MRKSVVAGIAAVVVAAAVVLFFLLDRERAPGGPRTRGGGVSEAGSPAEVEPPSRPPVSEPLLVAPIRPASFVDPDAPGPRGAAADEPLRVLVLDDATGIPVPGAEVAWADESRPPPARMGFFGAPSALISDFDHAPQRTVADARGVALVRTSPRLAVAARSGDRFGLRRFRDEAQPRGEIRLLIVAGPLVAARVVSESGAPVVGAPVMISMSISGKNSNTYRSFYVASRSPDGLAIAHHPGVVLETYSQGDIKEITAWIEGSGAKTKARLDEMKAGPITLVMPQTGRVVVKLFDSEGRPFMSQADVWLTVERPAVPFAGRVQFDARATSGSTEFPMIAVDSSLTASAEAAGFDRVTSEKKEGVKSAGGQVTIELRFQRRCGIVRGRVVDADGRPLSRRDLEAEVVFGDRMLILPAALRLMTDSGGRFSFEIDREKICVFRGGPAGDSSNVDLLFQVRDAFESVELNARIALPKLSADGETSLGDIRLTPVLHLASGVVVDELGAPVAGALVLADDVSGHYPAGNVMSNGPRNLPNGSELYRTRTDEFGAFQITNPEISGLRITGFSLRAEMPGYICDRSWVSGSSVKDFKIVLRGAGVIEGRILLAELAPVRRLSIHVRVALSDPNADDVEHEFNDCVDSTGAFRLTGIRPGTALVEIRAAGAEDPIAWVSNVSVPRRATTEDARLREIDLRAHPALGPSAD